MNLTIAYCTCRLNCCWEWFFESLSRQIKGTEVSLNIVVVDFYKTSRKLPECAKPFNVNHVEAKPSVWSGPHRLTTQDYFSAANSRNTALCLASGEFVSFVDDLSVLMPGWMAYVQEAMKHEHTITLGAYQKVFDLKVEDGVVTGFREDPNGIDIRNRKYKLSPVSCRGEWHWGSSLVAPVEAYLSINGWDENCDGMGYEDVVTGQLLENAGWKFVYDPRMLTWEDQELHQQMPRMKRQDKGVSPKDKSHAIMESVRYRKWASNYFEGDIRGLRQRVLAGEPFPIVQVPDRDWFDGQLLSEM